MIMIKKKNNSLLLVIALVCSTLCFLIEQTNGSFPMRELDCSGIKEETPLEQYKDVCSLIANWDLEEKDEYKTKLKAKFESEPMFKWDYLEKCTCNLLHHPLVWESLMTHEIETIYYVSQKVVQIKDDELYKDIEKLNTDGTMVTKDNLLYKQDLGDIMYFWDRFAALLLTTKAGDKNGHDLSKKFTDIYTDVYYKPEDYKILFKDEGETMNFRQDLSGSCNQLYESFGPFLAYFNNLRHLSENPRYVYRIVAYDENLYRLMVSLKMCQFLTLSGVVLKPN